VNDAPATAPTTVPRQEGWPCVRCGTVNDMELMECAACGYSFAADLATPIRVPGTRQSRIVITIGAVLTLLAMLALVIYLTTPEPAPKDEPTPRPITTQPIQPLPDPAP
jgi:hypothetical protein